MESEYILNKWSIQLHRLLWLQASQREDDVLHHAIIEYWQRNFDAHISCMVPASLWATRLPIFKWTLNIQNPMIVLPNNSFITWASDLRWRQKPIPLPQRTIISSQRHNQWMATIFVIRRITESLIEWWDMPETMAPVTVHEKRMGLIGHAAPSIQIASQCTEFWLPIHRRIMAQMYDQKPGCWCLNVIRFLPDCTSIWLSEVRVWDACSCPTSSYDQIQKATWHPIN